MTVPQDCSKTHPLAPGQGCGWLQAAPKTMPTVVRKSPLSTCSAHHLFAPAKSRCWPWYFICWLKNNVKLSVCLIFESETTPCPVCTSWPTQPPHRPKEQRRLGGDELAWPWGQSSDQSSPLVSPQQGGAWMRTLAASCYYSNLKMPQIWNACMDNLCCIIKCHSHVNLRMPYPCDMSEHVM